MMPPTDDGQVLLDALIDAPLAWQSPRELARSSGLPLDRVLDLMAELESGGWLAGWDRGPDVVATLSPLAAFRLGVRIVEAGEDELPRWARPGEPEPLSPPSSLRPGKLGVMPVPNRIDDVVDYRPGPVEAAELAEEAEAGVAALAAGPEGRARFLLPPRPTVFLGGPTPFDGWQDPHFVCRVCRWRDLRPNEYCLNCDRWGLDKLVRLDGGKSLPLSRAGSRDRRRADREREQRKSRHQARLAAIRLAEDSLRSSGEAA